MQPQIIFFLILSSTVAGTKSGLRKHDHESTLWGINKKSRCSGSIQRRVYGVAEVYGGGS